MFKSAHSTKSMITPPAITLPIFPQLSPPGLRHRPPLPSPPPQITRRRHLATVSAVAVLLSAYITTLVATVIHPVNVSVAAVVFSSASLSLGAPAGCRQGGTNSGAVGTM